MTIRLTWGELELDETGAYNEGFIADLRKRLKEQEGQGRAVSVELHLDVQTAPPWLQDRVKQFPQDGGLQSRYLEAAAHCRRRLKHCRAPQWTVSSPWRGPEMEAFTRRLLDRLTAPGTGTGF
ncbi:MAG: hypothetical protein LBO65_09870 [Spirochaetaceae bacterium]|nr:hypothetical protein [Spirochaetaceae bacterium]